MTRDEFLDAARQANISSRAFNLDGSGNERYVLSHSADQWRVYYSERGEQVEARNFGSESEALQYLLEWLKRIPSARLSH